MCSSDLDDLNGGEEVGRQRHEVHCHAEQREDEAERLVHGVLAEDHTDASTHHHGSGDNEDEQRHHRVTVRTVLGVSASACVGSAGRTP